MQDTYTLYNIIYTCTGSSINISLTVVGNNGPSLLPQETATTRNSSKPQIIATMHIHVLSLIFMYEFDPSSYSLCTVYFILRVSLLLLA